MSNFVADRLRHACAFPQYEAIAEMEKLKDRVFEPPSHLSQRAQAIWKSLVPRRACSTERLTLLQIALEALDRADAARRIVDDEGLTMKRLTTGSVSAHPMLRVESDSQKQFAKLWSILELESAFGLDGCQNPRDQPGIGRPG